MIHTNPGAVPVYTFGSFRLIPSHAMLLDGDRLVPAGNRALDILTCLVERAGEIVGKADVMAKVWPGLFVEDSNLRVHIAALRRLLGDGGRMMRYIANIPGRGYQFLAPVEISILPFDAVVPSLMNRSAGDYPRLTTRLVGRDDTIAAVTADLARQRLVTLTGPGGIGKTTVALAVVSDCHAAFPDGVRFVDFSTVDPAETVPSALASALGLVVMPDCPLAGILAALNDQRLLLVFDNCEHVLTAVADLARAVHQGAPQVGLLITSREPLRLAGESVHRLQPLAFPAASSKTPRALSSYAAVQLFVERASEQGTVEEADLPLIAEICRRLDGIPLAIELAAGQVGSFGIKGLVGLLREKFALLMHDKRRALPRHRTLLETITWSYQLLPASQRHLFLGLSIFAGKFETADVQAVMCHEPEGNVLDDLAGLIDKSLLTMEVGDTAVFYRFLDVTRTFARDKLEASNTYADIARRHAVRYAEVLSHALAERPSLTIAQWKAAHGYVIDNVRAALEWAFSPAGDAGLGVTLTLKAAPLWSQLSLLDECRRYAQIALEHATGDDDAVSRNRLYLLEILGKTLPNTVGGSGDLSSLWAEAHAIAQRLGDHDHQLQTLFGLWASQCYSGDYRDALATAERFQDLTATPSDRWVSDRMFGTALYVLGDQPQAAVHIERMLSHYVIPSDKGDIARFLLEQKVQAQSTLAGIQWLRGFADESWGMARKCIEIAQVEQHAISLCAVLAHAACPLAFYMGNFEAAFRYTAMLREQAATNALDVWHRWAVAFEALLRVERDFTAETFTAFEAAMSGLPASKVHPRYQVLRWSYAAALSRAGQDQEALYAINGLIGDLTGNSELWCLAEALRIKAEIVARQGAKEEAQSLLEEAIALAQSQGAKAWELRATTALAQLLADQNRRAEARAALIPCVAAFTEGWGTVDLRRAKILLATLDD